ncbi:MAG: Maf family protein, partial [Flavobacteriales bacterium]
MKITFDAMLKNLVGKRIILASGSPRRRELLSAMGLSFEGVSTDVDESFDTKLKGPEIPMY